MGRSKISFNDTITNSLWILFQFCTILCLWYYYQWIRIFRINLCWIIKCCDSFSWSGDGVTIRMGSECCWKGMYYSICYSIKYYHSSKYEIYMYYILINHHSNQQYNILYTNLYCTILTYTILTYTILTYTILTYTNLYCTNLYYTM